METIKLFMFFGAPLLATLVAVSVLQRLDEDLDKKSGSAGSRISSEERAGAAADFTAKKVNRAQARKADELERAPAFNEDTAPAQFEVPQDFNLAEFTGREEPQQA